MLHSYLAKAGLAVLATGALVLAAAQEADLSILHFNDVYEIEPVSGGELGGAARVATLVAAEAGSEPLILFSGDAFSPSLMSAVFRGQQMVDAFNQLGTNYAVFGNHEFDFGPEVASERVAESDFAWLSSNLVDAGTGEAFAGGIPSALVEWNGLQVGLLGLVGDWFDLTSAGGTAEYQDFITVGREVAGDLKARGAEVVIALTHMEMADDRTLAAAVPDIDLILGGHDHAPMTEVVDGTLIWKTGSDWRTLGKLKVYDLAGMKAVVIPQFIPVTDEVASDPEMQALVEGYVAQLDTALGEAVGETSVALDASRISVRTRESNYGNLITDAMRAFTGADFAIMNGGSIRTDQAYEPGELTRRDVQAVLPFGNVVISVELSGADVVAALENGVSAVEDGAGRFTHVSGLTYSYDPSRPAGERVTSVTVGGAPLDEAASYIVAINDYIGGGGDGFDVFVNAPRLLNEAGGPLLAEVVMDYITANSPVAPALEGRITTP